MPSRFTVRVKKIIQQIPEGKVATYGLIAAHAGNPRAARQVGRILHSSSEKNNLPWHRVVNRKGQISLKPFNGFEIQKQLLKNEGIIFTENDIIDFEKFLWIPGKELSPKEPEKKRKIRYEPRK